ncbi:MAG: DUF3048 domain-containing protein [Dethiobacteria bacterium]
MGSKRRKKRARIYLLLGVAVLLVLLGKMFFTGGKSIYTFAELSGFQVGEVQRLVIRAGEAEELFLTEDQEAIAEFFDILAPLTFKKEKERGSWPDRQYTAELSLDEGNFLRLGFAGEAVSLTFYEQGRKDREEKYSVSPDVTAQLEAYFNSAVLQDGKPAVITRREIEPALCVVINNYPESRPSSGLQKAAIVYEFLVEGGTTRYLAVFKEKFEENFEIGPIRSLRPYLAVQSLEHGGIVAHSGYSGRTKEMIRGLGLFEITDMGDNFWRDRTRKAPHNLYTSIDNLYRIAADKIKETEHTYHLGDEKKGDGDNDNDGDGEGTAISVNYSAHNKVSYTYDKEKNVYLRYINEKAHSDRETGKQYFADRVILQAVTHKNIPGPEGLVDIDLGGSGKGTLYEGGCKYNITWEKKGHSTNYYYASGDPVKPISGTTWIQIVRP